MSFATNNYEKPGRLDAHAEDLIPVVNDAARDVYRSLVRSRRHINIEQADLAGEAWCWLLERPGLISSVYDGSVGDPTKNANGFTYICLTRRLRRYAETLRAKRAGFEPDDQYFYEPGLLGKLLQAALDPDVESRATAPKQEDIGGGRGSSDPAHGNNWQVMLLDTQVGWSRATVEQQGLLWDRFIVPVGDTETATVDVLSKREGVSTRTMARRVTAALQGLATGVGGPRPQQGPAVEVSLTPAERYAARRMAQGHTSALSELAEVEA